jgi:hypothetical protein
MQFNQKKQLRNIIRNRVDHVMTNRKEMFFRSKRKSALLFIVRERQRTYCGSVFELRAIADNIFRYPELYDIKRAENDDARGACSRHQIFDVRANFEANLNCPNRKHHVFSVLYRLGHYISTLKAHLLSPAPENAPTVTIMRFTPGQIPRTVHIGVSRSQADMIRIRWLEKSLPTSLTA